MPKKERDRKGEVEIIHPLKCDTFGKILVYQPKTRVDLPFSFDNIFDEHADNFGIYQDTVQSLIPGFF